MSTIDKGYKEIMLKMEEMETRMKILEKEEFQSMKEMETRIKNLEKEKVQNMAKIRELEAKVDALQKSHYKIEDKSCTGFNFGEFFTNPGCPGLFPISEQIISKCDFKTLRNLRLVSKPVKNFIQSQRHWWILQLNKLQSIKKTFRLDYTSHGNIYHLPGKILITDSFPWYKQFVEYLKSQADTDELRTSLNLGF